MSWFPDEIREGQWWADNDHRNKRGGVYLRVGKIVGHRNLSENSYDEFCIDWRGGRKTWVMKRRFRENGRGYVYLGTKDPPETVTEQYARTQGRSEFIVLFADSVTWSSDDSECVTGNCFVIPESACDPSVWNKMIEQEIEVGEIPVPAISIPEMIRTLQDHGLWSGLVKKAVRDNS